MNINLTLVLQGINFFCAYCMIRRFFIKPILALIHHDAAQQIALNTAISTRIEKVKEQEQKIHDHWQQFLADHKHKMPHVQGHALFKNIKPPHIPLKSESIAHNMTDDLAHVIIKKVNNVRW
jgi:hypothetical protein